MREVWIAWLSFSLLGCAVPAVPDDGAIQCGSGNECPANTTCVSGRCVVNARSLTGEPCSRNADCIGTVSGTGVCFFGDNLIGTDPIPVAGTRFPSGYCSQVCTLNGSVPCVAGTVCVPLDATTGLCVKTCTMNVTATCPRVGFSCRPIDGSMTPLCLWDCRDPGLNTSCRLSERYTCDLRDGLCNAP